MQKNLYLALAFGVPFFVFLLTLAPTIYNLDSAELTTAAATGGMVRSTGYPLYLLLGRVWSMLPIGDVGYRMNLMSAFCGALTVALAAQILRRLKVGPWATLGALGLLASGAYFWAMSLVAEVYTLHTALMVAWILLLLWWSDEPSPARMGAVGLLLGLGLSHHAAMFLLVPGAVFYVLSVSARKALAPRSLLMGLLGLLIGLSTYLYLSLRLGAAPAFNYAGHYDGQGVFQPTDLATQEGLWWLVTGQAFADHMFTYGLPEMSQQVGTFGAQLWRSFFALGIGPGMVGLVVLLRRRWRVGAMLGLMFTCNAVFYINYGAVDKATMFLPVYLVWALWLGVGYQWLLDWMAGARPSLDRNWATWVLRGVMVAGVLIAVAWNWSKVDLSEDWSTRVRGEEILRTVEPGALVFGWWDTVPVIEYMQLVEGRRPDVKAINCFLISDEDMAAVIRWELGRRPIYVDSLRGVLLDTVEAEEDGFLYRLTPRRKRSD